MNKVTQILDAKSVRNMTGIDTELSYIVAELLQVMNYYGYGHFCIGAVNKAFKELGI